MNAFFRGLLVWAVVAGSGFAAMPTASQPLTPKERAQGFREHRILVRPKPGRAANALALEAQVGARLRREFRQFDRVRVLELDPAEPADAAIARLRSSGEFESVERDLLRHPLVIPNDRDFGQQWALRNTGQSAGTSGADISATTAWDTRTDASGVVVAIIDSGIRVSHGDLAANLWSSNGVHGINAIGSSTTNNPNDDDGHGTHVAGIIAAAGNNGTGISGVAWRAQLMALKFIPSDGSGSLSDELECIEYAIDHGAKIINASFGSSGQSPTELSAIRRARDAGIIFVAAAGNGTDDDGRAVDNDTTSSFPANYPVDNIVSVAATTRTDALASFSNYGSGAVELAAPGEQIYSTYNASDSSYQTLSGTSMATPHVVGALALLRAQFPNESYRQIINRLLRSTTRTPALAGKVQTSGRLNLAQALSSTVNRPFNDGFAERAGLSGNNLRVRSNNVGATLDNAEPAHAGATIGASLWWSWTAAESTQVAFDTIGSTTAGDSPLDTVIAIYTGTAIEALQSVAANDHAPGGGVTSRVLLNVTAGTTYQIAVAGKSGASGMVLLRVGAVPGNDDFARARVMTGESFSLNATLLNASRESGEPNPTGAAAGHSVWYRWTAPAAGRYHLAAFATQIDTVAAVYTGSSLNGLVAVGSNNNSSGSNSDALVPFTATAGTTYYFTVDHAGSDSDGGDFTVTLTPAAWEFPTQDEITSSPAIGADGTVYFGAGSADEHDRRVYAVSSSGTSKWTFTVGEQGVIGASPAVGGDGTVYIGGTDKLLYALNGATGARKWSFTAGTAISSAPAIATDGTIYLRDDNKLYALSSAGGQLWAFDLVGSTTGTYSSPAIGADGTVYVGTNSGAFYAVRRDGTQKWKYTANENVVSPGDADIYTSPAIAADGTIYFANLLGTVYAITDQGASAARKWTWSAPAQQSITSSIALGADGTLYFAGYDQKLHALSPEGARKWTCDLGDEVRASSPAVGADGTIYVGCYDGFVYAVSPTGTVLHRYATARTIRSSPAIASNRLYIGSADAKLYAIDVGHSAAASAWPMFHHDPARTGLASTSVLAITTQPRSQTVAPGANVTLTVTISAMGSVSYQWFRDGVAISGATSASYAIASVSLADAGSYTVRVTGVSGSVTSSAAALTVQSSPGPGASSARLANISARGHCGTGNNVTIGGFVVAGGSTKRVLIRAVGPSLAEQGLAAGDVLADPTVELHQVAAGNAVIATNDNWTAAANATEITAVAAQIGARALAAGDTTSSALLLTLDPGAYTFVASGKNASSGIVLLEIYDVDAAAPGARFVDIAARARAATGDRVAIGGFVISGGGTKRVLLHAVGPTLTSQGLTAAEVLSDPMIELHHGNAVIGTNDDWGSNANANEIRTTAERIGATSLLATDTSSSALLVDLQPGAYSFIASGKQNTSGIVLIEVYEAD